MGNLFQITCQKIPGDDNSPPSLIVKIFNKQIVSNRDTGLEYLSQKGIGDPEQALVSHLSECHAIM